MESLIHPTEVKFSAIMANAPIGILEMDSEGTISYSNAKGLDLLKPILSLLNSNGDNFHRILECIAPGILEKLRDYRGDAGLIVKEAHKLPLPPGEEKTETVFKITVNKLFEDSFIVALEDVSVDYENVRATRQALVDKTVAQGKAEIAADVLHDIGNAVVGFGSYLTRIRRSVEGNKAENLKNLAIFFSAQQSLIAQAFGEAKAGALVSMLNSMVESQEVHQEEIQTSITEQFNIITHIQEILNIQRQYVAGNGAGEKVPANLRSIIDDCLSMLYASIDKRGIKVSMDYLAESPVIPGDRTRLMQVVMNIVKNSIEAMDVQAAEKILSIKLHKEGNWLVLEIRDSGAGFDDITAGKLFGRGFTTKSSGTGLGLHNCRTILESHSGTIALSSEGPGKGTLTIIKFKI